MRPIEKFIKNLDSKRKIIIKELVAKIVAGNFGNLDIKKLKGEINLFRVRKGKIRIIFKFENGMSEIIKITNRSDNTY